MTPPEQTESTLKSESEVVFGDCGVRKWLGGIVNLSRRVYRVVVTLHLLLLQPAISSQLDPEEMIETAREREGDRERINDWPL